MISLLIAATIWAAPPRPVLFTATTGGHSSRHMGNRHYVSVIQRAAVGRPPWRPEWFAPSNIGYRSFTLSVTGADYSLTTPDFRWAIAECSYGTSATVTYRIQRAGVDWQGYFWTNDSLFAIPAAQFSGGAIVTFTPSQPNMELNLWWGVD